MAIPRNDFEALAKDRPHQLRVENLEWCALSDDAPVGQRDDA